VVAIDTGFNNSVEEVMKYRKQFGITMPIVVDDGKAGGSYHLRDAAAYRDRPRR
jgi:hypothetical protein